MYRLTNDVLRMARIYGAWCGPNWTAARAIPASGYDWTIDPRPFALDALDEACKDHDRVYGTKTSKSARRRADIRLKHIAGSQRYRSRLGSARWRAANIIYVGMRLKTGVS